MKPWPAENIDAMRHDARDGLTMRQSTLIHGWNEATVRKHAKLHAIAFRAPRPGEVQQRIPADFYEDHAAQLAIAKNRLRQEIAAAKREALTAPLYRGGW